MVTIAIRIIADSTCDLSPEDQERLNIEVVPLTVRFAEGDAYLDGVEISNEDFYKRLDICKELPTTSQVPPQTFIEVFKRFLDAGDDVIGIFISSEISGTYNSACVAKDTLGSDRLFIIDSRSGSMSLGLLAYEAAKHRDRGFTAEQIVDKVTELTKKVRFLAAIDSLKYLRKGGRISATSAVVGEVLGIKPIVTIVNGTIHNIGKARGMTAALKDVMEKVLKDLPDPNYGAIFCTSCAPDVMEKAVAYFNDTLKLTDYMLCSIGSVIGTYAGRGVVGISYISKKTAAIK